MKKIFLLFVLTFPFWGGFAQSGTLSADGVYVPRLTTAQRSAIISPTVGQMIYNTDDDCFNVFQKDAWQKLCGFDITLTDTWTQKANFAGAGRKEAVGFSINDKGYFGTGFDTAYKKDFWEYNPTTDSWTQKADFGGVARFKAVGFSIGLKGYVGTGNDGTNKNDFWEFDPSTNVWTSKMNFGGTARNTAVGFSVGSKGYIGTGTDGTGKNDFWEYDPTSLVNGTDINGNPKGNWLQKANFGGTIRSGAVGFSMGNKGYIGTGFNANIYSADFWEYNQTANTWVQKADFGGLARSGAVGFSITNKAYIGTGNAASTYKNDFWEYDATSTANGNDANGNPKGNWTQKTNLTGGIRFRATGFSIGNKGYIGMGSVSNTDYINDFWEYSPVSGNLTTQGNNFNAANQLTKLDASGFLGIDVAAPKASIHLSTTVVNRKIILWQNQNYDNDNQYYGFGVNGGVLRYQVDAVTAAHVFYAGASASTSTELMRINGNGTACLNGNMVTTGASCTSDIRYKKDFSKIENPLDKILKMNGLYYFWKTDEFKEKHFSKEKQIGFVAQEVEKIFPELVQTDEKGY